MKEYHNFVLARSRYQKPCLQLSKEQVKRAIIIKIFSLMRSQQHDISCKKQNVKKHTQEIKCPLLSMLLCNQHFHLPWADFSFINIILSDILLSFTRDYAYNETNSLSAILKGGRQAKRCMASAKTRLLPPQLFNINRQMYLISQESPLNLVSEKTLMFK